MSGFNGSNGWNGNGPNPFATTGGDSANSTSPANVGAGNLVGPRADSAGQPMNYTPDPNDVGVAGGLGQAPQFGQGGINSATNIANNYSAQGAAFQGRAVPGGYGNLYNKNVTGAQANEAAARARELGDIDKLSFYAHGGGPSISGMAMGQSINSGLAGDFAAGHGRAGMSAGISDAATHGMGAINTGGHAGLQEAEEARGAYQNATGALRAGDLSNQAGAQNFAIGQAQLNQAQAAQNDRMQLQYEGYGQDALADQLRSETSTFDVNLGNQADLAAQQYTDQAALNRNLVAGGAGAASGLASGIANVAGGETDIGGGSSSSPSWADPSSFGINQSGYDSNAPDGGYSNNPDVINSDRRLKDVGQPTLAEIMSQSWGH